jgi:NAD(P)-dependent dehydrogenase (short-subunit alcohol dehydrogenase family)
MAVSRKARGAESTMALPHPFFGIAGKVVVITGAERGIGRALAVGFAQAGARLVINYLHSQSDANATVRLVREARSEAIAVKGDVGAAANCRKLVMAAYRRFGRLDGIVNNAGVHIFKYLADVTETDWDTQLSVNLRGPFFLTQKAVSEWRRRKTSGTVVNITSCGSQSPFPASAAYNASKSGLLGLTRQLALELAPEGIRVNAVAPGVVHTSMNDTLLRQSAFRDAWQKAIPAGRVARPEDLIGAVLFLCSDASGYITGQQLAVDGGWGMNLSWAVAP